jgi:predicted secreted protein
MRTRLLLIATGVIAAAALIAASLAVASSTLHLTWKDNHKMFGVDRGSAIVVTLASCADCGYHWKNLYSGMVKLVSHRYVQPKGQVGGMGKEIWKYKAIGHEGGNGRFRLHYVSPAGNVAKRYVVRLGIN